MKRLVVLLACIFLSFSVGKADNYSDLQTTTDSSSQLQTVVLDIVFAYTGNSIQFHCPEAHKYGILQIDAYVHNVNTATEFSTTVWIQMIDTNGYSEVVPCTLTDNSYINRSEIQVMSTNPNYVFDFNVSGIMAW